MYSCYYGLNKCISFFQRDQATKESSAQNTSTYDGLFEFFENLESPIQNNSKKSSTDDFSGFFENLESVDFTGFLDIDPRVAKRTQNLRQVINQGKTKNPRPNIIDRAWEHVRALADKVPLGELQCSECIESIDDDKIDAWTSTTILECVKDVH